MEQTGIPQTITFTREEVQQHEQLVENLQNTIWTLQARIKFLEGKIGRGE